MKMLFSLKTASKDDIKKAAELLAAAACCEVCKFMRRVFQKEAVYRANHVWFQP